MKVIGYPGSEGYAQDTLAQLIEQVRRAALAQHRQVKRAHMLNTHNNVVSVSHENGTHMDTICIDLSQGGGSYLVIQIEKWAGGRLLCSSETPGVISAYLDALQAVPQERLINQNWQEVS